MSITNIILLIHWHDAYDSGVVFHRRNSTLPATGDSGKLNSGGPLPLDNESRLLPDRKRPDDSSISFMLGVLLHNAVNISSTRSSHI
jgi:hypothetical protein